MHGQARAVHIQGTTIQLMHIRGPTIQTYEGPQGPGIMLLKSGTVPEIRGPLRPMVLSVGVACRPSPTTRGYSTPPTFCARKVEQPFWVARSTGGIITPRAHAQQG